MPLTRSDEQPQVQMLEIAVIVKQIVFHKLRPEKVFFYFGSNIQFFGRIVKVKNIKNEYNLSVNSVLNKKEITL